MHTHAGKKQENNSKATAHTVASKNGSQRASLQLVNNRPEAIAQRKLQGVIDNKPQQPHLKSPDPVLQKQPAAANYAQTDVDFINEVLVGDIQPDINQITWELNTRSAAPNSPTNLLWVIPFNAYECQLHIHHDPVGSNPANQPTRARGHLLSNNRSFRHIVNNIAITLLERLVPRDKLGKALDAWSVNTRDRYTPIHRTNPLARGDD